MESRKGVFIIAATNRPELIDPAMMRPGRLDKLLYVPLPTPDDRVSILNTLSAKVNLAPDVQLEAIARSSKADGFSGADCAALLREAGLAVPRDDNKVQNNTTTTTSQPLPSTLQVTMKHLEYALDHVIPSVSKNDRRSYDNIQKRMGRTRPKGKIASSSSSSAMDLNISSEEKSKCNSSSNCYDSSLHTKNEKNGTVLN